VWPQGIREEKVLVCNLMYDECCKTQLSLSMLARCYSLRLKRFAFSRSGIECLEVGWRRGSSLGRATF
jgi:hypothetical protein